jgi:predicted hydrocarbon binding protein
MAGQLLSQEKIQMPHISEQIRGAAYRQEISIPEEKHVCQCFSTKDLAGLATKLCKVMKACAVVPKDKSNAAQHYMYASSDAILEKVNPALVASGLATVCNLEVIDRQPRTTNGGGMWELCTVRARLTIIDSETGASIESEGIGQGYDGGDKSLSKAQTQARKYAWLLALNISTGDDPEGDSMTDRVQDPAVLCKHCGEAALHVDDDEFEGVKVRVYACAKCKKETRIKEFTCPKVN